MLSKHMTLELNEDEMKLLLVNTSSPEGHKLADRLLSEGVKLGCVVGNGCTYLRMRTEWEVNEAANAEISMNQAKCEAMLSRSLSASAPTSPASV
jgi:Na+-transporting NADH:ubiquinone oxidoreductase subunit NqrF